MNAKERIAEAAIKEKSKQQRCSWILIENKFPNVGEEVIIKYKISITAESYGERLAIACYCGNKKFVTHNDYTLKIEKEYYNVLAWKPTERI